MSDQTPNDQNRFRRLLDEAPVYIWESGPDGKCTYFNKPWYEFTGRNEAQEIGEGWVEGVHPDDFDACIEAYAENFYARQAYSIEYRLRRHDGEYRWILDSGSPRLSESGEFLGYTGSCIDITNQKLAMEENQRSLDREKLAREQLEQVSRLKDEFLNTLSLELRTPLNSIVGWSDLLLRGQLEAEEFTVAHEVIYRSALEQTRLINDLLDMSKIMQGQLSIEQKPVELMSVIRSAMEAIELSARAKKIDLAFSFDPCVGPIAGDTMRVRQALWNLLTNAVKFTPVGGSISIDVKRVFNDVEIVVADSGEGIDSQFLPHIFEKFRQENMDGKRPWGGLGLGLAMVRHLVELHGGQVSVKSEGKGKGASFKLRFPLMAIRLPHLPGIKGEAPSRLDLDLLRGLKVLVLDDQKDVLDLARLVLTKNGAEVLGAASVVEALGILSRTSVDLVLSDLEMPEVDGYEFLRQVQARGWNNKVVAFTAHATTEDRVRALDAGFHEHLTKPVDASFLVKTVAEVAGRNWEKRGTSDFAL